MEEKALSSQLNRKNNFDFLRFFFAISVIFDHFYVLSTGDGNNYWPLSAAKAVAGFFIISGFLITWSYCNNSNIKDFFTKRAKRIMPAYYTVVIICALFLCFISTQSFLDYFSSTQFFKYLAANFTFLNFIEPKLPGVFAGNLEPAVNGSLWTIKVEIALYFCVPLYCFFTKKGNKGIVFSSIYVLSFLFSEICYSLYEKTGSEMYSILGRQFIGQLKYFISGAILLFFFDQFKKHIHLLTGISILVVISRCIPVSYHVYIDLFIDLLFPISFAILIIGFAFSFKYLNNFGKYGDFSYGIYLIHFPVIQTLLYFKIHEKNFVLTLIISFVITIILAALSWHLIEKHFLKRR